MSFRDDQRGQSIQIGAVLLFGVLIISFATYQAFIVPNQNEGVESNHVAEVRQDMQELRNAIVSVPSTGAGKSVTVSLGTTYPSRIVAVNPPPPSGTLRTLGTTDGGVNLTVANARATDDEVRDRWTGQNYTFNTGGLAFGPGYNEYRNPPTIVYDNTVLFEEFRDGNLTTTGQSLVDGNRLRLVALNGSVAESKTGAVSVDVEAISASSTAISVTNKSGSNVTIDFASRRSADTWEDLLRKDDQWYTQAGHVYDVTETKVPGSPFRVIHLELEQDETYTLQMAKVGVGTRTTSEAATYLAPVTEDGKTVQAGSSTDVVVEVRDRFNNPVSGVSVHASAAQGEIADSPVTTDADGEAVFQYNASGSGSATIEFSMVGPPGGDFDANAPENATVNVDVGGGSSSGPVSASWESPTVDNSGGLSNCDANSCTWDVGAHGDDSLVLRMGTKPAFENVDVDFTVDNATVGTLDPNQATTDTNGEATTDLTANNEGVVTAYFTSSAGSDSIDITVTNVSDSNTGEVNLTGGGEAFEGTQANTRSVLAFDTINTRSDDVTLTAIRIDSTTANVNRIDYDGSAEILVDADGDGFADGSANRASDYSLGERIDLGTTTVLQSGDDARWNVREFRRGNNAVDIVGEDVTVTIWYEDSSGVEHSSTFTIENVQTG